jgi:thiol-disulfide isomerase/thioredoxin
VVLWCWGPWCPKCQADGPTIARTAKKYGDQVRFVTIAPFLAVTGLVSGSGSGSGDIVNGLAAFVAYGLGMGVVVGLLAMLVALAQDAAVCRTRAVLPRILRISGAFLLLAGLYVAYYGWYELRAFPDDPVIGTVTEVQGQLTTWLDALGVWWIVAAFTLTAGTALAVRKARRRHRRGGRPRPAVRSRG